MFMEHDDFNMLFVYFIRRQFTEDISSQGRIPQMKTLIEMFLCLIQLAILRRPFAISYDEFWYKLLVPDNITAFPKDEKSVHYALTIIHAVLCCLLSHS